VIQDCLSGEVVLRALDRLVLSDQAWERMAPLIVGQPDQKGSTGRLAAYLRGYVGAIPGGNGECIARVRRSTGVHPPDCTAVSGCVHSGRPKRGGGLEEAATFVRSELGISLHAWGQ
jgi:hypothetical protein